MTDGPSLLTHSGLHLRPDPSRTVIRPFDAAYPEAFRDDAHPRVQKIVDRVLALDTGELQARYDRLTADLGDRHRDLDGLLQRRFDLVSDTLDCPADLSRAAQIVIGAYFSEEYSFEAAALFNPSMVLRPDQSGVAPGTIRLAIALRGIGEGHISSVTFRTGTWSAADGLAVDPPSPQAVSPRIDPGDDPDDGVTRIVCEGSEDASESVLFPVTPSQRQGIEDLRLTRFVEDDGAIQYLGTYTAFDGRDARCEMLRINDFRTFEMHAMTGAAASAKGMALFPRKVGGRFMMLGRQDNESIWLLSSDSLYHWEGGEKLIEPRYPWEFVQMGNCGSPIEIDEGWLVLTHGVGAVRNYCMGAALLDRNDPSRVLARTPEPILMPGLDERDGYVPNVVYSCGSLVHDRTLLMPYGVADNFATFAHIGVDALLAAMDRV